MMITFLFYFQETYNNRLRETYGDDPSTDPEFDPDLWMEAGSSGGPDKNRVYGLSNTRADNLRTTDTTKRLMSSPKCRSVEVINNPARPGSNHREVNCINYK